jgi:hypothetical protein
MLCYEVEAGLEGCERVVVHSVSNNGQALWSTVLRRLPALAARVAAFVFDCGACMQAQRSTS